MAKLVLLDTGVLGLATNPKATISGVVLLWIKRLLREGHRPLIPEIADYELRRELIRIASNPSIEILNRMGTKLGYLPLTQKPCGEQRSCGLSLGQRVAHLQISTLWTVM